MEKDSAEGEPAPETSPCEAYGKMVEALLMPDENGMVKKDRLADFFRKTLGTMFSEDKTTEVLDSLKCSEDKMIRLECFLKAFAERYCTEETLSGIVDLLESRPEAMESAWDWKGMLSNVGLELTDDDLKEAVQAAKNLAGMLLSKQSEKESPPAEDDQEANNGQIFQTVKDNLHLMGLGKDDEGEEEKPQSP